MSNEKRTSEVLRADGCRPSCVTIGSSSLGVEPQTAHAIDCPRAQRTNEAPPGFSEVRCTLCGAARIRRPDGTPGACSLIDCKDPLHDARAEKRPQEAPNAKLEAIAEVIEACVKALDVQAYDYNQHGRDLEEGQMQWAAQVVRAVGRRLKQTHIDALAKQPDPRTDNPTHKTSGTAQAIAQVQATTPARGPEKAGFIPDDMIEGALAHAACSPKATEARLAEMRLRLTAPRVDYPQVDPVLKGASVIPHESSGAGAGPDGSYDYVVLGVRVPYKRNSGEHAAAFDALRALLEERRSDSAKQNGEEG